jgi:hypothetical protein
MIYSFAYRKTSGLEMKDEVCNWLLEFGGTCCHGNYIATTYYKSVTVIKSWGL